MGWNTFVLHPISDNYHSIIYKREVSEHKILG